MGPSQINWRRSVGCGAVERPLGTVHQRGQVDPVTGTCRPRAHLDAEELDGGIDDTVDRARDGGGHHGVVDDDDHAERAGHWKLRATSSTYRFVPAGAPET